jgi:hypothetical protein
VQPPQLDRRIGLRADQLDLSQGSNEVKRRLVQLLPRISVNTNRTTSVDLSLDRGAEISGTVMYDDGSPAIGAEIKLLLKDERSA